MDTKNSGIPQASDRSASQQDRLKGTVSQPDAPPANLPHLSPAYVPIEDLTEQILQKEFELYVINSYFRVRNGRDRPGKRWRVLVYSTLNYNAVFAGLLVNFIDSYANIHGNVPEAEKLEANIPRLAGKCVSICGVLFESMLEIYDKQKEKKEGFSIHQTDKRVLALSNEIKALMKKRAALVETSRGLTENERRVGRIETTMLSTTHSSCVSEYIRLHARSVSKSFENRQTNLDALVKYGDSSFGTNLLRILTALHKDPHTTEAANISTVVSAAMATLDPIAEIAGRKISRRFATLAARGRFAVDPKAKPLELLRVDSQRYEDEINNLDLSREPLLNIVTRGHGELFNQTSRVATDMDYLLTTEQKMAIHRDKHSVGIHLISGLTKLTRGIMINYAYYHYPSNTSSSSSGSSSKSSSGSSSKSASSSSSSSSSYQKALATEIKNMQSANESARKARQRYHGNQISAASSLIYACGKGVQCVDIWRTDFIEIFKHKQLKAKRSVFGTILSARINSLNDMEDESKYLNHIATGAK